MIDIEGNIYNEVKIGTQVWTVENLRTTKYNDGTAIPHVTNATEWSKLTTGAYCFYNNSKSKTKNKKWGALYNWYVVNTGKLAPSGWRVPTDADWSKLAKYLIAKGYNYDGTTSGNKIAKSMAAKTDWYNDKYAGLPAFSAIPSGFRNFAGYFVDQSYSGLWWSATENAASNAYGRYLFYGCEYLRRNHSAKRGGFSVRLICKLEVKYD